jgi:hypothetical protein
MKDHDPVSGLELGNILSGRDYHSRSLVAKDAGSRVRSSQDFLQVGSANTTRVHTYEELARTDRGHRNRLHSHIVLAPIDGREHRGRNGLEPVVHCDLSSDGHHEGVLSPLV